jgi:hypothetical protein
LNLPRDGRTIKKDAEARINGILKPLIGPQTTLVPKPSADTVSESPVRYEQVHKVGDAVYPIFGTHVTLYYAKEGHLATLSANVIPPGRLKLAAPPGTMSAEQAAALARNRLRVSDKAIRQVRKGIYLAGGEAGTARIAFQVSVAQGEKYGPVIVYIDETSRDTLEIK